MFNLQNDIAPFGFKVLIHEGELDQIAGWVLDYSNRETGGDLFGFWTHSGAPAVQFVLGPGPQARHEATAFYQDRKYLSYAGSIAQREHGLQHIGEWHSHHQMGLASPSGGDLHTLRLLFERYDFPRFLLCIANIRRLDPGSNDCDRSGDRQLWRWEIALTLRRDRTRVEIGAFLLNRDRKDFLRGLWVVLPGRSPMAHAFRHSARVYSAPHPIPAWDVPKTTLARNFEHSAAGELPRADWYTEAWGTNFLRDRLLRGRRRWQRVATRTPSAAGH